MTLQRSRIFTSWRIRACTRGTTEAAAVDEAAKLLPILVQQTVQLFLVVTGGVEGGSAHAVWQSAWQGWQSALTPLRCVFLHAQIVPTATSLHTMTCQRRHSV